MKRVLQSLKDGKTVLAEAPVPSIDDGELLIRSQNSLLSSGTEKMLLNFGKAGWIEKARQQPDKVKLVRDKLKTDGIYPTIQSILNKLDQPIIMGYSNVGVVEKVGASVNGFSIGDRVVSNGAHSQFVAVPKNLCCKVPNNVCSEDAAFTVVGSVALQSVRLVSPTLGETVAVFGLGLVGLMAVQLLRANGCRVIGLDFDERRLRIAETFGAQIINLSHNENPVDTALEYSRGRGADAVIIATATDSNAPIKQAANMCRKRGRVVLVGVAGLNISRDDFFEKEISFQVSASYGPGRYDRQYEELGQDYPIGYVRWTEQRNFEAFLDMVADGKVSLKGLVSHEFKFDDCLDAYGALLEDPSSLGILINYPEIRGADIGTRISLGETHGVADLDKNKFVNVGFVGAGNYAVAHLIPAFKKAGANLVSLVSKSGVSGLYAGKKFGFSDTSTNVNELIARENVNTIVIATRHDTHAHLVIESLKVGKNIFVEKPLCLELDEISAIYEEVSKTRANNATTPCLMVGFNRRFSVHAIKIKDLLLADHAPKAVVYTVNAGALAVDHWTQDAKVGGGRIIGEVCHFIDLLRYMIGSKIKSHSITFMRSKQNDTVSINLGFDDGSIATIHYFSNGARTVPKERIEIFSSGKILCLNNFRVLTGHGYKNFKNLRLWRQDKGQQGCVNSFVNAVLNGGAPPISFDELIEVSRVSIELSNALKLSKG